MILDAGEEDPHGVSPVVQMRDPGPVEVAGQLVDVCLQLGKGWERRGDGKESEEIFEKCIMKVKPFLNPPRTKSVNPSYRHGVYWRYDEDDRKLKIVFMSEELNISHLSLKKIPSPLALPFDTHTHTHICLLFSLIFIYQAVNWL